MIYLDNNATTPVLPEVFAAMEPFLKGSFGNPSAGYRLGKETRRAVENAREQVAALIEADPTEIVFTSGGTESINTALRSAIACFPGRRRVVTTQVEHSATNQCVREMEAAGIQAEWLGVNGDGLLDLQEFRASLTPETAIASLIWGNNETGVLSAVPEAAAMAAAQGILLHTDAVQTVTKMPISVRDSPIHLLSISGHKFHAPKGIGALFVSRNVRFHPLLFGGGQEGERRSGTENVAGIVGLGMAAELGRQGLSAGRETSLKILRDGFEHGIRSRIPEAEINGDPRQRLPNTSNLYFPGVDSEAILVLLDREEVYCSPGSACSSGARHPSHVLTAMGMSERRAKSSVRFSVSELITPEQIDQAVEAVARAVQRVRMVMPGDDGPVARRG